MRTVWIKLFLIVFIGLGGIFTWAGSLNTEGRMRGFSLNGCSLAKVCYTLESSQVSVSVLTKIYFFKNPKMVLFKENKQKEEIFADHGYVDFDNKQIVLSLDPKGKIEKSFHLETLESRSFQ